MIDFDKMTKRFILGESSRPSLKTYLSGLQETLSKFSPRTQRDALLLENAKNQLTTVKRSVNSLLNEINMLKERISILEESTKED